MKTFKAILFIGISALLLSAESCMVKMDCRGRTKHKLPNGIWM